MENEIKNLAKELLITFAKSKIKNSGMGFAPGILKEQWKNCLTMATEIIEVGNK